jgi:phage terminase large subunit
MYPEFRFKVLPPNKGYKAIDLARGGFSTFYFDAKGCELGLQRLGGYHYEYSVKNKIWSQTPKHDENSHGADAFQYAVMSLDDIRSQANALDGGFKFKTFVPKEFSNYQN